MSRGYALEALIALRCDAHKGEWLAIDTLAASLAVPRERIQEAGDRLVDAAMVEHAVADGVHYWGVGVEGVKP